MCLSVTASAQPVYLFYNILSYGFSIGGSIHYASRLAEGRADEGNRIFTTILKLLLAVYVITAALGLLFLPQLMRLLGADPADMVTRTYIRTQLIFIPIMFCQGPFYFFVNADNGPKTTAIAMSVSGILDAIFSYVFILRMHLGVQGSVYHRRGCRRHALHHRAAHSSPARRASVPYGADALAGRGGCGENRLCNRAAVSFPVYHDDRGQPHVHPARRGGCGCGLRRDL